MPLEKLKLLFYRFNQRCGFQHSDISSINQPFSGQLEPRTITASEEEKLRNDCRTGASCRPANQTQLTTKYGGTEQTAARDLAKQMRGFIGQNRQILHCAVIILDTRLGRLSYMRNEPFRFDAIFCTFI